LIIPAGGTALSAVGDCRLRDDGQWVSSFRGHGAGAGNVSHRTETHLQLFYRFAIAWWRQRCHRDQQTVASHYLSFVAVIDRGQGKFLARDVLPDIEFCPVRDRKHAHVLPGVDLRVEQVPKFRSLSLGVPLTELVTEGEYAFLGAGFLLITSGATNAGIEAELLNGLQQGHSLSGIPGICLTP